MTQFCQNCGAPLRERAKFCPACGTQVKAIKGPASAAEALENNDYQGERVRRCKDGKYRWKYKMNMVTNPTIYLTVFKIFFYIFLAGLIIGTMIHATHGDWDRLWDMAKAMLIMLGVFAGLTFLGVLLVAAMYGGKYIVLFEMDENQIYVTDEDFDFVYDYIKSRCVNAKS